MQRKKKHSPAGEDDAGALLARHALGDPAAFGALLTCYGPRVRAYLVRSGAPDSMHDDLLQEIFVKVHRTANAYDPSRPFDPWLFTIAANTVKSALRRDAVRRRLLGRLERGSLPEQPQLDELATASETAKWLEGELARLSFSQRQAVVLCCLQDLSMKDAAHALGIPLSTLKTHLRRARLQLSRAVKERNKTSRREVP